MPISPPLSAPSQVPLSAALAGTLSSPMPTPMPTSTIECSFDTLTAGDGALIHYKDWGEGPAVVFSHGWPLSSDAWEDQMFFLAARGFRVIAHDRRGHGRSSQPWKGNDMDTYADDLAALVQALELENATFVGHSTGGGEVVRYIGRHGTERVARVVLVGAVPPLMLRTPANPGGLPMEIFDGIRAAVLADRSQFFKDLSIPFYGYDRPGVAVSEGVRDAFWRQGMMASLPACHACIAQFSEIDFSADLRTVDVPALFIHGSDDQMVPIDASSRAAVELVENARLLVYEGASHGLPTTHKDRLNADLLAFLTES